MDDRATRLPCLVMVRPSCGELLLPQAQAILRQVPGARQSVQGLLGGVKGRLVVGSIPTIMPYFVARHVPLFLKQYPEVDLHWWSTPRPG
jgi:DNA-binding transcriptional LysR family regulator